MCGPFIENLLAQRGIIVTHESIRLWCNNFGSKYAARLRRKYKGEPREIVADKLRSYGVAHRELSHQPTRVSYRGMRRFKSVKQAQRFLSTHAAVYNLFNLGRYLVSAETYRYFRLRSFASWKNAAMV